MQKLCAYTCEVVQGDGEHVVASSLLEGLELDGGWRVVKRIERVPGSTGSNFSTPYLVERATLGGDVEVAFLKALNLSMATGMGMPIADALKFLTNAYVFERDLVLRCSQRKMTNVIAGVAAGQVRVTHSDVNPFLAEVPYIIFEHASEGDIRTQLINNPTFFDEAWAYRVCHGAANGLRQLHQDGISHQDLKPSNVMSVGSYSKLGDLGRASLRDGRGPYDGTLFAGDATYAPPECLYREMAPDPWTQRLQTDMYQLGSLLVFMFAGTSLTGLLHQRLPPTFHWTTWPNDYRNVLPYVRNSFDDVCSDLGDRVGLRSSTQAIRLVRILSDPDPMLRGWPRPRTRALVDGTLRLLSRSPRTGGRN